jgi:hypothetical protein
VETEPIPWWRSRAARGAAAVVLFAASVELARFDHGLGHAFFWAAFVVAPVVLIFGAAAAGVRRWYGWPDLGPTPGRAALLAGAVVAGSLLGHRVRTDDVLETRARGEGLRRQVRAWREANGRWPERLADAVPAPPRTRLGLVSPPSFAYDAAARTLSFPIGGGASVALDLEDASADWSRR